MTFSPEKQARHPFDPSTTRSFMGPDQFLSLAGGP